MEKYMKKLILLFFLFILFISCSKIGGKLVLKSNFENGETGNWKGRGAAKLAITDETSYKGKHCLLTNNRTDSWNGPSIDLTDKIFPTGTYKFSAWAKIKKGQPKSDLIMTIERVKNGKSSWDRVTAVKSENDKWINLKGIYEAKEDFDKILVYIESSNPTLEFYIDEISISTKIKPEEISVAGINKKLPSLSKVYDKYFKIGTCVELDQLIGKEGELLIKHFSSITPENIMKPRYLSTSEDKFYFDDADKLVNFALENKKLIRGHTLLWHQQSAEWMFYDDDGNEVSKEVLLKRLEKHIKTVVSRYKDKIYAWDVVNEVVETSGLRKSKWLNIIGEEYIEKAFIYANEADPNAKLFINEYDTTDKVKGEVFYNLVKKLIDKGIPVHGIGLQYHISLDYPSIQAISDSLKKYNDLGLEIHITELDMSLNADPNIKTGTAPRDLLIRQAHRYKEIFDIFKTYKSITNVTFWGFQDGHTWLTYLPVKKADWPLIFDNKFNTKYAYWALVKPSKLPENVKIEDNRNKFVTHAKKGTPKIDAIQEEIWDKAEDININIYVQGKGSNGIGKALWDDKNLYIFINVKDNNLSKKSGNSYEQDSIEVFIDEKNNKSVDYMDDDAQYRLNYVNEFSYRGNPAKIKSKTATTKDGYNVEIMIPFQFIQPGVDSKIGFDLQINDDNGDGKRSSIAKWNDATNESYRNTSGFGTLIFIE
jgi:endo-1,4-beta-xylanase